ncbi:hypothetical protein Tco_0366412 [Tanacetum coccineum]
MMPLKFLRRHTADLIEKYSALPGPESIKNQESEKSPKRLSESKGQMKMAWNKKLAVSKEKKGNPNTPAIWVCLIPLSKDDHQKSIESHGESDASRFLITSRLFTSTGDVITDTRDRLLTL